jgi:uncharacterized protein YecT (DUF1311 family)
MRYFLKYTVTTASALCLLFAMTQAEDEVAPARIVGVSPSGKFYIVCSGSNKTPQLAVVSASDQKIRVPLPIGEPTDENMTLNQVFISPDENWIFTSDDSCSAHLYHRTGELQYAPASPACLLESAFHFFSEQEKIDEKLIGMRTDADTRLINFVDWSSDSRRLLLALSASIGPPEKGSGGNIFKKGIGWWLCYFNTETGKFELTDRLRTANRDARKGWDGYYGPGVASATMPLSAEPVGQEGAWMPETRRFEIADKRLNQIYAALLKKLEPPARDQLKQEQREWLIQRDTDAAIHANQRWSPFGKAALMEGKAIATEARTADLEKQLKP